MLSDNIIKVWRLYPYAQESLAPLMSFYCAHTPVYMTVLRHKLGVAFQEPASATYSVVMYNIRGKSELATHAEDLSLQRQAFSNRKLEIA